MGGMRQGTPVVSLGNAWRTRACMLLFALARRACTGAMRPARGEWGLRPCRIAGIPPPRSPLGRPLQPMRPWEGRAHRHRVEMSTNPKTADKETPEPAAAPVAQGTAPPSPPAAPGPRRRPHGTACRPHLARISAGQGASSPETSGRRCSPLASVWARAPQRLERARGGCVHRAAAVGAAPGETPVLATQRVEGDA